jgi:hypothetical protein
MSLLGEVGVFDRVIQTCSARHMQAGFIMVMYVGWWWWWWWCFYFGSNNNQQSKISVEIEHRQYSNNNNIKIYFKYFRRAVPMAPVPLTRSCSTP